MSVITHMQLLIPVEKLSKYKSRNSIPIACKQCGKTFHRSKNDIQKVLKKNANLTLEFCSKLCANKNKKKTIHTICAQCGKSVITLPCRIKKTKNKLSFCDKTCAAIYNNQHRILEQPSETCYRNFALKNLPNQCAICGYNKYLSVLQVHHKDKNRKNNTLQNLEILCPTHHEEWHLLDKSGRYNQNKVTDHLKKTKRIVTQIFCLRNLQP